MRLSRFGKPSGTWLLQPGAFRQRVSRARRTLQHVIDNRCGLVDPANRCRCGIEQYALQLDEVAAIGDLYWT